MLTLRILRRPKELQLTNGLSEKSNLTRLSSCGRMETSMAVLLLKIKDCLVLPEARLRHLLANSFQLKILSPNLCFIPVTHITCPRPKVATLLVMTVGPFDHMQRLNKSVTTLVTLMVVNLWLFTVGDWEVKTLKSKLTVFHVKLPTQTVTNSFLVSLAKLKVTQTLWPTDQVSQDSREKSWRRMTIFIRNGLTSQLLSFTPLLKKIC